MPSFSSIAPVFSSQRSGQARHSSIREQAEFLVANARPIDLLAAAESNSGPLSRSMRWRRHYTSRFAAPSGGVLQLDIVAADLRNARSIGGSVTNTPCSRSADFVLILTDAVIGQAQARRHRLLPHQPSWMPWRSDRDTGLALAFGVLGVGFCR